MDKKCVLITGATGFIGRVLADQCLKIGWRVKGTIRDASSINTLPAGVEGICLDLIEDSKFKIQDFIDVDTIVHLAARAHVINDKAQDSLEVFRRINVQGTERLVRMAVKAKVKRFIFISSVKVNGEGSGKPYTENDLPAPQDAYGISKREAEDLLVSIGKQTGLEIVILRLPLVYGPGVKANFGNLIRVSAAGWPLPFKSINNRRSFLYLGNLVDAIITSMVHPLAAGQIFMVSDNQDISTLDLIKIIASAMGRKPILFLFPLSILRFLSQVAGRSREMDKLTGTLLVDNNKIRGQLNWCPPFSLEEGIKETVKHYKL